ncbi:MAG: nucleotidyltransferase family protein [Armatimonadota bacterium]
MLLSAGYGTRLGGLTENMPKPMLSLHGRPLIDYLLSHLAAQGIHEIAVNLHFMPEVITEYLGNGSRWDVALTYAYEPELLGTAGAVRRLEDYFREGGETFLVHYGDILTDQDFGALLRFHRERRALATILVHQRANSNSIAILDETGRVTGFLERPSDEERRGITSPWVHSGICLCEPDVLDLIPETIPCDFPRDVFPRLLSTGRLYAFPLSGYRCAIDSPARLEEARAALAEGRCRISLR